MTKELNEIVEQSYKVFSKYKAVAPLDACTACCLTKNQESELVSMAVRHIPFDLLYEYNTAAKTEKPSIEEFKHFLPRFLELTAELKFLHHDEEIVLSRFEYYDKKEWTDEEQEIIQAFGESYFRKCLEVYPLPELASIDGILIMLMKAKMNIEPMLADWSELQNKEAVLHFNHLINYGFKDNKPNELSSAFADKESGNKIIKWLDSERTKDNFSKVIETLIMEPPSDIEEGILTQLSWTYEKLKITNTPQQNV